MSIVTLEYEGITITYDENNDRWNFELRGRKRYTETLKQAKEAIDKVPAEKKKEFKRFSVYRVKNSYYGSDPGVIFTTATVTSYASDSRYHEAWIVNADGSREKVPVSMLLNVSADNDARISEYKSLQRARKELDQQLEEKLKSMLRIPNAPEGDQ